MIQLRDSVLAELLTDPVMAAYVLMGWELDTFQQARLRMFWFVPNVIDSSGVSTAKTLVGFVYVNLRCLLLSEHRAGVYFPNWGTMQTEFWPYFQATIEKSAIYREQLTMKNRVVGEHKLPGVWSMRYRNGNTLIAPAPSFMKDAETQGSRRFNTLLVDEWLRAEDMGEGISKQLVDRVTRPNFNDHHPIWTNHIKFFGHADRPSHKGYTRVKAYRTAIRDGSTRHALVSFCFRDYSEAFIKKVSGVRPDYTIKEARATLSKDQFRRQWLGIWSRDGSTYYPESILLVCAMRYLHPAVGRVYPHEMNFLGFDTAPGMSIKADYSAAKVFRVVELIRGVDLPCNWRDADGRPYNRAETFAHQLQGMRAAELAAFIHLLHRMFVFERIVLDPGGGGLFVYAELKQPLQKIHGTVLKVTPLCTQDEPLQADKLPIVRFFKRAHFPEILEPGYYLHDGGFIAGMHLKYREAWEERSIYTVLPFEDRRPEETADWTPEQRMAQTCLDISRTQLVNVRQVTDSDGRLILSRGGFPVYEAAGKKDLAYSGFYAYAGSLSYFRDRLEDFVEEDTDVVMVG